LEEMYCSSVKMYSNYRPLLEHNIGDAYSGFGEAISKVSKIHNLFIHHQDNTNFGVLDYSLKGT
jgi:hypothetical protein